MIERTLPVASSTEVRSAVRQILEQDKRNVILAAFLLIIASSAAATATRLLGSVIDAVSQHNGSRINIIGTWMLLCIVTSALFGLAGRRKLAVIAERALTELRTQAFEAAMALRLATIERVGTADPLSRLTGDVGSLSDAAHDCLPILAANSVTLVIIATTMLITSPVLGLTALASIPIFLLIVRMVIARMRVLNLGWLVANAEITREIHEMADGASTVRAFAAHKLWRNKLDAAVQRSWDLEWPITRQRNVLYPMLYVCQMLSLISVMIVGYFQYKHGHVTIGMVSAITLFVIQIVIPTYGVMDLVEQLQRASASLARIVGLTHFADDETEIKTDKAFPASSAVQLRDVHFKYATGQEVLHGINMQITAGERIAVVGVSGSGKSTIAKLIAGVHTPTSGELLIGNVPIEHVDSSDGRRAVVLVTQESHVFLGTIADNCRLARAAATDDEIHRVLATVGALEWVQSLADGINTDVGRNGYQLNLVQAQQLSLARVLLVDPLVVILDEATAGLGTQMARGIERSFGAVLEGRTVITIAHRLDVAATADRVAVVSRGNVEIGTHEELLAVDGTYANMWSHWLALQ